MRDLIDKLIRTGFADLEGLRVTGSVPVRQELVNEAIQSLLQDATRPKGAKAVNDTAETVAATAAKSVSKAPSLPKEEILKMVKRAEVKMQEGRLVVEFDIQR